MIREAIRDAVRQAVQFSREELRRQYRHRRMGVTDTHAAILGKIRRAGGPGITLAEAEAMDWRTLQGLFTRRKVEWFASPEGIRLRVRPTKRGRPRKNGN